MLPGIFVEKRGRRNPISGIVFDIKKFSVHDGPGIRTTVFFKGCPLNCWWCHNPEGLNPEPERIFRESRCIRCGTCVEVCGQNAISWNGDVVSTDDGLCILCGACVESCHADARGIAGREMTVGQVMEEIERDTVFYEESGGGVTFSGGEPLLQRGFLLALLRACSTKGIHTALDTCGFFAWETFDDVRSHVDLFLFDLKLVDASRHRKFTGVSNGPILENLRKLSDHGEHIFLRVPIIPGVNDDDGSIDQIGNLAAGLPNLDRLDILPYHRAAADKHERLNRMFRLPDTGSPSEERMAEIARRLGRFGLPVKVGG